MGKIKVSYKAGDPLPKSVGACADYFKVINATRLLMDKEVKEVKARENEIKEYIIENLSLTADTGASGLKYQARVTTEKQPTAEDWDKIHDFVYENDRFDLMAKSLNNSAIKEMWEAGEKIPGVTTINVKKLSITKVN